MLLGLELGLSMRAEYPNQLDYNKDIIWLHN